ncbi:hypothetical protein [Streptosporangium sp. NPDC002524]|uniref:hypothetical protein n=1 Tax=Streptosporangium sp. NPDC002524 TaxID=3154537 RepID=UPI003324048D
MTDNEREKVFTEVLAGVLDEPELTASTNDADVPSAGELREAAMDERASILGQVRSAEEEYRRAIAAEEDHPGATTRERAGRGTPRLTWILHRVAWGAAVLVTLATCVLGGWSAELTTALTERRPLSLSSVVSTGFVLVLGLVVLGAFVAFVTRSLFWLLSPAVRVGNPSAEERRTTVTVTVTGWTLAVIVALDLAFSSQALAWQLTYQRLQGPGDSYGWAGWVFLGVLAVYAAALLALRRERFPRFVELVPGYAVPGGDREQAARLESAWREALHESLLGFMRAQISTRIGTRVARRYATTLDIGTAPGLRRIRALDYHVPTSAETRLIMISDGMDGGSIALSGPRGVGKTELLRTFCAEGDGAARGAATKLSVEVTAPVLYDRREFMLHLFAKLCVRVMDAGLKASNEAARNLRQIRYLQTRSAEATANAGWGGWGLSVKRGTGHSRQPLTYPEIVQALTDFLELVAKELDGARPGRRLVVGIDELDRIVPATGARDFLNELKAVFDVPHCLFVLSVSDEALREADLAPAGRRDAFDSAIDEVVRVEPLDHPTAVKLLDTRVIGLPAPFSALFYCLSGGIPRDLLRTARAAVALVTPDRPLSLAEITAALIDRELARIAGSAGTGAEAPEELLRLFHADLVHAHGGLSELGDRVTRHAAVTADGARLGTTLANRAYHMDTLSRIFSADLSREMVVEASDPGFPGSFSALARAQREIGATGTLTRSTLQQIRQAWALPPLPPIPPLPPFPPLPPAAPAR